MSGDTAGQKLKVVWYDGIPARYREGTTDEKVLRGLILNSSYRKKSIGFDVVQGETWLDLGANVGAFAIYCRLRNATAVCYEPDIDCFNLLVRNAPWFTCVNAAVTALDKPKLQFNVSKNKANHYRGTILTGPALIFKGEVANVNILSVPGSFDGVKMDIEGSEFGIIDNEAIPKCSKLVMEYHTSRDDSPSNLRRRIDYLKSRFRNVSYPPEYDRKIQEGKSVRTFQDREIFCWNPYED